MKRTGVNERQFGKWWMKTVYLLSLSHVCFSFLPLARANQVFEPLSPEEFDLLSLQTQDKRGGNGVGPSLVSPFLRQNMPRFSRRTTDHMLRFTRGGNQDDHMLRFTRGGRNSIDDEDHMLRFTRGGRISSEDEDHMLRFTRNSDDDYMLRFNRNNLRHPSYDSQNDNMLRDAKRNDMSNKLNDMQMLRFARSFSDNSDKERQFTRNVPLNEHMLRFSKKNDDNHMLRYSRSPMEMERSSLQKNPKADQSLLTKENTFARYTRKIMDSMKPRLLRQDDHLLRFA
ncbi:uncharacterized protein [Lepeophtheirus salmonis]|uniref:uncharacterized protein n=1 Tax=Lepeophtheirus salmonis TaxID=72036 RepID=UPI001AE1B558|nr:uncharacterized protein LOC121129779 [Lepeophtheirus salmonis]